MILKTTLTEVVKSQRDSFLNADMGVEREILKDIKLTPGAATVITGIRRAGKSTLLRQLINKKSLFNYLNFEDVKIFGFDLRDFVRLEEVFSESGNSDLFFFDEIQNVDGWERYIRTLLDKRKTVIITGSNASLLSRELGTRLTGRHRTIEIYPFSFNEFLSLKKAKPSIKLFDNYFNSGGFPLFLNESDEAVLQELFNDIIARDITVKYSLRNAKLVKELALNLISNVGKEFSYQKLKKNYSTGSVNTVISLVGYYEESYLLFTVPQFDYSLKKQQVNAKKIYCIDNGLINSNSVSFSGDTGRKLENLVFVQLKRMGSDVFYFSKDSECDFIARFPNKQLKTYQVCFSLTEDNKDREINGLLEALRHIKQKEGIILTYDQKDEFEVDGNKIIVMPVWEWLLN
jgi:uncharacterized protein